MKYQRLIIIFLVLVVFTIFFRTISASSCTDCVDNCVEHYGIFFNCASYCVIYCQTPICGDGYCNHWETLSNCPKDCYVCGDGICTTERETYSNCFIDCNSAYYVSCAPNYIKDNGACMDYDVLPYTIVDKNLLINPTIFGNIKVVGGNYIELDSTTNTTDLSIRKVDNTLVTSNVSIFNIGDTKKSFVMYLNPVDITENYLEAYKFFFNLIYGSNPDDNKDISLQFRLFK